jgi:hypothetical protein
MTEIGLRKIIAASNVCTQAFAVPEIVFVKADVYFTCRNMAILIPNPVAAVKIWQRKFILNPKVLATGKKIS